MRSAIAALVILAFAASASHAASAANAGLAFDRRIVEIRATPDQTQAVATYTFTNDSGRPVTITAIDTACDCTTAATDKKTYASGEKGTLTVTFEFGQRVGPQDKTITLTTDHGKAEVRLMVHIPELLAITPRLVFWRAGEKDAKTIKLEPADGIDLKLTKVETPPTFTANLEPNPASKTYTLTITPTDQAAKGTVTLTIRGELSGKARTFQVFAKIL